MRTEVKIRFDGQEIPGGPQAVLEPARCGPDVADVEDVPVLRQIVVWVTLDATDERLPILLDLLRQHGETWLECRNDIYTDEELDQAPLVVVLPGSGEIVPAGSWLETHYDRSDACPVCCSGRRPTSPVFIDGEFFTKLEGRRAVFRYYSHILVDERLAEELERIGVVGLSFRPVYAVMEDKRQIKLRWRQMCAARELPPTFPRSTGIPREYPCRGCDRSGFTTKMDNPPRLMYRARDLSQIDDVNWTWEWFGDLRFNKDGSQAQFPYRWFLVTPKVMRVIRAAEPTAFNWLAVRVVDDDR